MYGKAIKCDACDRLEMVNEWTDVHSDLGVEGWIRMSINNPKEFSWTIEGKHTFARKQGHADLCSLSCARSYLRLVEATISQEDNEE